MGNKQLGNLHKAPVRAGAGLRARHLDGVIILEVDPRVSGPAGGFARPFRVRATGEDGSNWLVRVTPGTVNNITPDTIDGEEDWVFAIGASVTRYIYLKAHMEAEGTVDAVELYCAGTMPTQAAGDAETGAPPEYAYRKVADVVRTGSDRPVITNYLTSSQWVSLVVSLWGCSEIVRNIRWDE